MNGELKEIVAKAARDPAAYLDLTLLYQRGHDLSGITRFEVKTGSAFSLSATNPRRNRSSSFEGELDSAQRTALLAAIDESGLLEVPPSSRNIGDDEQPVLVELGYDDHRFKLLIWADDAAADGRFAAFEGMLWKVLEQLSDGVIRRAAAASTA